ncbi:DNA mismatch repair endonuclease MutL [Thermanaerothrix sp. 4228-RoL]|uniref:DNA mismatch repair protein MutL n=1 Tax=Thermanaerothrix solaris TaxID=3058434 RepID=A0ABU3NIQ5_9CHLR|nr:DNA mismatch repair endonuclease MutL [Thermanaerothrix sp. 4228-RoL]MDT8896741.1 DNA mismatch repair endonuclease MutL [Thermanaerothrix sp. 4228-RoL]
MPIQVLSEEVAAKIAAGEVVERPVSVIKELVENALDAKATEIIIETGEAGKRLIEVADNGCGISYEELPLAIARFATSKLKTAEDLFNIRTLGFRGEALASIAAVSRLTLISCPPHAEHGGKIVVQGGKVETYEPAGVPPGTVVRVEDLFYNVPARLKFLKQDSTERNLINALISRYAVAYPEVRFRLVHDGKVFLQTYGHGDRREILATYYGVDVARQMLEVILEEPDLSIQGFTSPIALTRSNRRDITFFVNGRWIQDVALTSALLQAYHTMLMVGRYPISMLFIWLDPETVDVNVHPTKAEVRFRQPERVFSAVQRAVRRALLAQPVGIHIAPSVWSSGTSHQMIDPAWQMAADLKGGTAPNNAQEVPSPSEPNTSFPASPPLKQTLLPESRIPLLRLVGQVGATYLVAEGPDGLYLIDQHAAHERVLFERMWREREQGLAVQPLLNPQPIRVPGVRVDEFQHYVPMLRQWGFEVEPFGGDTFLIRSVPAILRNSDPVVILQSLLDSFEEDESLLEKETEARLIARICKRAAVKGGQVLSREEQEALLRDLEACESPRTCPHGRPTMIHLSVEVLERQFGRRGSR